MEDKKVINFETNYTMIKVDEDILKEIADELSVPFEEVYQHLKDYNGKFKEHVKITEDHNLVPSVLRDSLATLISGTTVTPTFKANYIALGSDSTAATNADTTLGSEDQRGLFTNRYSIDNIAYLDKFWSAAEVGGTTVVEIGVFVDGTATVDTGYLLSRIITNETFTANETFTVNVEFTIS